MTSHRKRLFGLIDLRGLIKPVSIGAPQPRIAHRSGVVRKAAAKAAKNTGTKGGKHAG
jgi:hypothetical protein